MRKHLKSVLIISCALACGSLRAEFMLPAILSDNMMLQRDKAVQIWGKGDDGTKVTVAFKDQVKTTVVKDGEWLVALDPEQAGGPYEMKITHGGIDVTIKNILMGEVWLASGQSNMQASLTGETYGAEAINEPANDMIRLFDQERQVGGEPMTNTLKAGWRGVWSQANPASRKNFSAVAYYFARDLQKALGVPVGISSASDGGTKAQFWTPLKTLKETPGCEATVAAALKAQAEFPVLKKAWEDALAEHIRKKQAEEKTGAGPLFYGRAPCLYYNGMIHPIRNFTIRGVIWYQGEDSSWTTAEALDYRNALPTMIMGWRDAFQNPDMPFLFVQLPRLAEVGRDLPPTRESQMLTEKNVKNTGMVVTVDVGDEIGLHPKLKRPIGLRLSALAQAKVYGKAVEFTGPRFRAAMVKGTEVVVSLDDIGQGVVSTDGQPLKEFTICGVDNKFFPAQAKIVGDTIVVSSDAVAKPVAVRYAWRNAVFGNLSGKNGFPVGPFRTDAFELPEKNPTRKQ